MSIKLNNRNSIPIVSLVCVKHDLDKSVYNIRDMKWEKIKTQSEILIRVPFPKEYTSLTYELFDETGICSWRKITRSGNDKNDLYLPLNYNLQYFLKITYSNEKKTTLAFDWFKFPTVLLNDTEEEVSESEALTYKINRVKLEEPLKVDTETEPVESEIEKSEASESSESSESEESESSESEEENDEGETDVEPNEYEDI